MITKQIFLYPEIQNKFSNDKNIFNTVFHVQGKIVRDMQTRKTIFFTHEQKNYFAKLHFGVGWKEIFKDLLQGRLPILGAKTEFVAIQNLEKLNINTMECVGFGQRGLNPATLQSFIITREIENVISLEDMTKSWQEKPPSFQFKIFLIKEIATIARTLHAHGLNHRDFYLCHFLYQPESHKIYLIDLHRMQCRKKTPRRWQVKDLGALYFSAFNIPLTQRDRLRFIQFYTQKTLRNIFPLEENFWQQVNRKAIQLSKRIRG